MFEKCEVCMYKLNCRMYIEILLEANHEANQSLLYVNCRLDIACKYRECSTVHLDEYSRNSLRNRIVP